MAHNKTGIVILTIALIRVAFFVVCDGFIDRKNFFVTAEKGPYIRSITMNTPKATLNEWDGKQWAPWTSGKTLVSFSDLEKTKHLKAQYLFPYTNKTYEREYIFQLSKPIWEPVGL